MLNSIFNSIFTTTSTGDIAASSLIICTVSALILGLGVAGIYMYHNTYTKNFVITLALMPVIVHTVILMVNGNLGTGIAVMGAFSLVRFRSVPGSAKEICSIFLAMAIGLATSTGNLGYAVMLLVLVAIMIVVLDKTRFGQQKNQEKLLKITIPENLDYEGLFDDLFRQYTKSSRLVEVKTTNMGSLYELHYNIVLKDSTIDKAFLDALRCRNGNLNIVCGRVSTIQNEL